VSSPQPVQSPRPPLPPIPDEQPPSLSPKKSDVQSRKEKAKEEKERKALEKEREKAEKERERAEKLRRKEADLQHARQLMNERREAEEVRRAIEASKADIPKNDGSELGPENGSPRKLSFLRRGSRSLSQRLSKDKEPRVSTSDLPPVPTPVPEAPQQEEPAQPPVPPMDTASLSNPKMASRSSPPAAKDNKPEKTGRWRSLSLKKS
jgi:ubiquitin carboxyl-terminal hydrolase 9/13